MIKKKIIINLTEEWFFVSHFLSRAVDAKRSGYDVYISCNEKKDRKNIEKNGIKFFHLPIDRVKSKIPNQFNLAWESYTLSERIVNWSIFICMIKSHKRFSD